MEPLAAVPASPSEDVPLLRILCRAFRRSLAYWFPPDPPQVIAIVKMPERMYCVHCGTDRVARHCPNCGRNVDKQYQKMVTRMATYVVAGTEQLRRAIAADVQRQLESYTAELVDQQKQRINRKLEQLERAYVMQIVRQKRQLQSQLTGGRSSSRRPIEMGGSNLPLQLTDAFGDG